MVYFGGPRMSQFSVGQELPSTTYIVNRALLLGYANASGDQNPIHQDEAFAQSVGLENVIAHGMFTMALAGRYASSLSEKVTALSCKFLKPVAVPAGIDVEVVISGKVSAVEGSSVKIDLTATCGDAKVLGMAKATITAS